MNKKQYVVIGLGRFGKSVAETLYDLGNDVLVIDPYCKNKKADFINNITMYSNLISKSYPQQYSYDSNYKKTTKIQKITNIDPYIVG